MTPVEVAGLVAPPIVLIAYGVAVGVLIDLDHFLIARYRTGTWDAVRFCLRNPSAVLTDQSSIFDTGDVGVVSRLCSHLLIAGPLVLVLAAADAGLAVLTAVVLYVHLVSDVLWDLRNLRRANALPVTGEEP